jgi:UDP-N-acetyl-D-mannosaminuronate dehydrogenase
VNIEVDCVLVTIGHNEFKGLSFADMHRIMPKKPVLIDVRGLFDEAQAAREGIYYRKL